MEGKSNEDDGGIIGTWLKKHHLIYSGATRHPFILSIRDGTIDLNSFKRWLVSLRTIQSLSQQALLLQGFASVDVREVEQDYIFVRAFVPFVSSVLLKAWKESDDSSDMEVILGGVAALNDEIAWFKNEACRWGVLLSDAIPQRANQDYCRFLERLMSSEVEYTVAITAFWAIEAVYQESFALCLENGSKTPEALKDTCQRWGSDSFSRYCRSLKKIASRHLGKASDDVLTKAEVALLHVLEHEVEFWNMSRGET